MKLYLAGQITPTPKWLYKWLPYFRQRRQQRHIKRFFDKANELEKLGHTVFNPPAGEPPNKSWNFYIVDDIIKGFEEFKPDAVYMMTGWQNSAGARFENEWANQHNIKVIYETN